jgi:lysozyme
MTPLKKKVAAAVLSFSALGITTLLNHEGNTLAAYVDPVGVVTVCAGHTKTAKLGQRKTLAQCERLLKEDTAYAEAAVKRNVTVPITQEQYDSLVSFVFNVGSGAFAKSTLLRKLNAGDCMGAGAQFSRWIKAGGRVLKGLVTRRADERANFETGCTGYGSTTFTFTGASS